MTDTNKEYIRILEVKLDYNAVVHNNFKDMSDMTLKDSSQYIMNKITDTINNLMVNKVRDLIQESCNSLGVNASDNDITFYSDNDNRMPVMFIYKKTPVLFVKEKTRSVDNGFVFLSVECTDIVKMYKEMGLQLKPY